MSRKTKLSFGPLKRLGGPPPGTVAALAIGGGQGSPVFVGSEAGIVRARRAGQEGYHDWQRLATAPLGVVSLATSPCFVEDYTLVAGAKTGIFVSYDAGASWMSARIPISGAIVVAIGFSPNYAADGILMAGTLEDGVLYSSDRGRNWQNKSFGMIDAAVYSLAFSPSFARDATAFVGTETTLYTSYNGGLAWKEVSFPAGAPPIVSLALSPIFQDDHTLFAGTENDGLYRSTDGGQGWQKLGLPAGCINALLMSPEFKAMVAATEAGVFVSADHGDSWESVLENAAVISLAAHGQLLIAGVAEAGLIWGTDLSNWKPIPNLYTRPLLGLVVPPEVDLNRNYYVFGPQDGMWKSEDGAETWDSLNTDVVGRAVTAMVASADQNLAAASATGVWLSLDGGTLWRQMAEQPTRLMAFAAVARYIAGFANGAVRFSADAMESWLAVPGPWDEAGQVLALGVDSGNRLVVAWLEATGATIGIWHGQPGKLANVLTAPAGHNPLVSIVMPGANVPWYASLGNQVWTFDSQTRQPPVAATVFPSDDQAESILSLNSARRPGGQSLLALTGQHVFKSNDGQTWSLAYDFGNERAVALVVPPSFAKDKTAKALLLGGVVCQFVMP